MGLSWATPIYIIGLYGLIRFFSSKPNDSKLKLNWSPFESVAVTVFTYFAGQIAAGLVIISVPSFMGWNEPRIQNWIESNSYAQFGISLLATVFVLGLLARFLKSRNTPPKLIGLSDRPVWGDVTRAFLAYGGYFVTYIAALTIIKILIPTINLDQKQQIGFDNVTNLQLPIVFISLVILPPIMEEIVMRGFLYTGLRQRLTKISAALITSVLFAIAHLQAGSGAALLWVAAIDTFILSLILVYLREKTGKLWAPIFLHGLKNLVAFLTLFVFVVK